MIFFIALKVTAIVLIILTAIFGNLTVIVAVVKFSKLRTATKHIIINLSIADLLLGLTVMPISLLRLIYHEFPVYTPCFCALWTFLDVLYCSASINLLFCISFDRFVAVSRPLQYSSIMTGRVAKIITIAAWILSTFISYLQNIFVEEPKTCSLPIRLDSQISINDCKVNMNLNYVLISASFSFFIPATANVILYYGVYREAIKRRNFLDCGEQRTNDDVMLRIHVPCAAHNVPTCEAVTTAAATTAVVDLNNRNNNDHAAEARSNGNTDSKAGTCAVNQYAGAGTGIRLSTATFSSLAKFKKEKKAAITLGIVVGCFLICWLPFFVTLVLVAVCESCDLDSYFEAFFWLGYFNSCLNPFIYVFTSNDLKKAFVRTLHSINCVGSDHLQRFISNSPYNQSPNITSSAV